MSDTASMLAVACVQQSCASADKQTNLECSEHFIHQAAQQGNQLVLLQELHSTPYFCQQERIDVFAWAEPLNGPTSQRLQTLAAKLDIVLIASIFEQRAPGLHHNTALVFDGAQGLVGQYRKMHIPDDPGFYEKFYFTPGDAHPSDPYLGFKPIATRLGRLGVLVCWDQWFPEAARLMALAGADLLLYPTAIGWDPTDSAQQRQRQLDAWRIVQQSHAIANGLPIVVANRCGLESGPADSAIEFWGNSFIAGPQGELLAQADAHSPGIIQARIDRSRCAQVRQIWPFLRDRRIDAYTHLTQRWLG